LILLALLLKIAIGMFKGFNGYAYNNNNNQNKSYRTKPKK